MTDAQRPTQARPAEHPLIESYRIEGTRVYDRGGKHVGSIDHLVIDKVSGRVVYAVASFGGFLGIGERLHTIPWERLDYDPELAAYRVEVTEAELKNAPNLPHNLDQAQEDALRAYWMVGPYGF
jgi:sporulation protein YlmC with PRC-barrel domain